MCLVCGQTISVAKEYNLECDYETHCSKCDHYKEQLGEVKSSLNKQQSIFTDVQKYNEATNYTVVDRKFSIL
jgi:Zn-finger nucleic acid-binding protein